MTGQQTDRSTETEEAALISVAKTLGRAAGKLALKTGLDHAATPAPRRASKAKAKLVSKNKPRVPRREKKARQKSAGSRVSR
jgi:hypothetical protein